MYDAKGQPTTREQLLQQAYERHINNHASPTNPVPSKPRSLRPGLIEMLETLQKSTGRALANLSPQKEHENDLER
jgi:hypothetical protein